ncbi:hypothetical protein GCM10011514_53230 [Emticicia aquatilis]|uniref:DUF2254 domain-containing protein n=1 Tax=Emticicia aquatilis TaxID=1537369 RepID=A0A917DZ71_9BACT|nr:DUF2254 family protein [Emticicia aquatilis]GGD82526.1 hypothetical protein GCM10011514_53230 [Emticicia aquatilis]
MKRKFFLLHEHIKQDWRYLSVVAYVIVATLTIILHILRPGQEGVLLDGYLSTLASIVATLVVTTFSFVFVALQLASVQFSPRILRSFFEYDHFSRFFLWSFLACVGYLMGLQYFGFSDASLIYPKFGIVGSFYLILLVFPLFIHHVVDNINASSITQNIAKRTIKEIDELYEVAEFDLSKPKRLLILNKESGYLDSILYKKLFQIIPDNNQSKVLVKPHVGSFVLVGMPLVEIECSETERDFYQQNLAKISNQFIISKFRSYEQDIPFGIRQLVDIAIKAISPAVNDPTTALNCIDYLGNIIKKAALSNTISKEATLLQKKNIYIREFNFEQLVDMAFDQIYHWGKEDYIIVRHLIKTITNILPFVNDPDKLFLLLAEVEDMELSFLKEDYGKVEADCPFKKAEHRNSLRDHLADLYEMAISKIEQLGLDDRKLLTLKKSYERNLTFMERNRG